MSKSTTSVVAQIEDEDEDDEEGPFYPRPPAVTSSQARRRQQNKTQQSHRLRTPHRCYHAQRNSASTYGWFKRRHPPRHRQDPTTKHTPRNRLYLPPQREKPKSTRHAAISRLFLPKKSGDGSSRPVTDGGLDLYTTFSVGAPKGD